MINGLDNIFGVHEKALVLQARRASLIANNIANDTTPGFKARDIDFKSVLNGEMRGSLGMTGSSSRHLGFPDEQLSDLDLQYRLPMQKSLDGNTVDAQLEHAAYGENAVRYRASLSFITARVKGITAALRGE